VLNPCRRVNRAAALHDDLEDCSVKPTVVFNPRVRLILADVDETIADVYTPAAPRMLVELEALLTSGVALFLVSGASLARIQQRVVSPLPAHLRRHVLVSHCSGAEVWGYTASGQLAAQPFYSAYDTTLDAAAKTRWREVVGQLVNEFSLVTHAPTGVGAFKELVGDDPFAVMLEDRGPQITLEFVNSYNLTAAQAAALGRAVPVTNGLRDLRIPVMRRAEQLLQAAGVAVAPRLGGIFALDLALGGVSKTRSVRYLMDNDHVLTSLGLTRPELGRSEHIEIWGDRFDRFHGGTDRHMQEAVSSGVRAIDFRDEDPSGFLPGYNTVLWDGTHRLHAGLLEYLQSRHHGNRPRPGCS